MSVLSFPRQFEMLTEPFACGQAPGIYSDEQLDAWKKVTAAVHAKGGFIFSQLWALGRANFAGGGAQLLEDVKTVAPSPIGLSDDSTPAELSLDDIQRYIGHYKQAASNAHVAGFDGVEVHGANGYLVDQFLQTNSNKRTDTYGGSLENRTRFLLEAVGAAVDAIGQERVGVRLSRASLLTASISRSNTNSELTMCFPSRLPAWGTFRTSIGSRESSLVLVCWNAADQHLHNPQRPWVRRTPTRPSDLPSAASLRASRSLPTFTSWSLASGLRERPTPTILRRASSARTTTYVY